MRSPRLRNSLNYLRGSSGSFRKTKTKTNRHLPLLAELTCLSHAGIAPGTGWPRAGAVRAGPPGYAAPSHMPRAIGHAPLAGAQRVGRGTASGARRTWQPHKRTGPTEGEREKGREEEKIGMLTSTIAVRTGCGRSEADELRRATVFEARARCDLWEGTWCLETRMGLVWTNDAGQRGCAWFFHRGRGILG